MKQLIICILTLTVLPREQTARSCVGVEFKDFLEESANIKEISLYLLLAFYGSVPLIQELNTRDGFHN